MSKLSISSAWDQSREILARDSKLFAAVALALMVLPGTVTDMFTPAAPPGTMPEPGGWVVIAIVAVLIGLVGQLAIVRLAAGPAITVGDAIRHGARRLPAYAGSVLLWTVPIGLVFGILAGGANTAEPRAGLALVFLLMAVVLMYLLIRLSPAVAVASQEEVGPVAILKRTWAITRGNWWRLFAFLLLCGTVLIILYIAAGSIVGSLVGMATGPLEPMSLGTLIVSLAVQIVTALASTVILIMLARIYIQLAAQPNASVPDVARED